MKQKLDTYENIMVIVFGLFIFNLIFGTCYYVMCVVSDIPHGY